MNKLVVYLIYFFLFLLPWQTRLILRPGVLNSGNWEYGIIGIYGTEILLWLIVLLLGLRDLSSGACQYLFCAADSSPATLPTGRQVQKRNWQAPRLVILGIFIVLAVLISLAPARLLAIQQFIHILEAIAIFILLTRLPIDCLKAAYAFLAGLALQAILGIYQFLTQSTFASQWLGLTLHDAAVGGTAVLENSAGRWLRAHAGLPHPNIFGGYMAVGILLAAVLLSCFSIEKKAKIFLLVINCLLVVGLFFSFSRSAWLGLAIGLLIFWFIGRRQFVSGGNFKLFFISTILLLVINSLLFSPLLQGRLSGEGRLEIKSAQERLGGYGQAWQLFIKHPFLGVGLGNYTLAIHNEIDLSRPAWDYQPLHNSFLLMLTELGALGVLIILFFCCLIGCKARRGLWPIFALFFLLAIVDHYLWSLYSGLTIVGVGAGLLTEFWKKRSPIF